jgi:putative ABC transport system permease protein
MSLDAILANKLRTVLTLVGIVAGVASIIAVMTAISLVQATMEREMSVLGAQTFQVQKWPAGGFTSDAQRRRAMRRPALTLENAAAIRNQVPTVDLVGSEIWDFGSVVQYKGETTNPNISIVGGTPEYAPNNTHFVGLGRNLSCSSTIASTRWSGSSTRRSRRSGAASTTTSSSRSRRSWTSTGPRTART